VDDEDAFLSGTTFAVVGASRDRSKYGNRVLRAYLAHGLKAVPVNPNEEEVEGLPAVPDLAHLPERVDGVSIITPPEVSARVVDEALALGYRNLWLQPGAEDRGAVERARRAGARVLAYGPCVLVALGGRPRGKTR
jgi:predicted CoA-binding protein